MSKTIWVDTYGIALPPRRDAWLRAGLWLSSTRPGLWVLFFAVSVVMATVNLWPPASPLGDVTGVYHSWAKQAVEGWQRVGIDVPWVYPILAAWPMTLSYLISSEFYGFAWIFLVVLMNAVVFRTILSRGRLLTSRLSAARWWLLFMFCLGPIALGRIDSVTAPIATFALLIIAGRPRLASLLLTVAMWMKVWPAALLGSSIAAMRSRFKILVVGAIVSAIVVGVSLALGAGANVFGFISEQGNRGLQVESPLALPWLWLAMFGVDGIRIVFSREILTTELFAKGTDFVADVATPIMGIVGILFALIAVRAVRRTHSSSRLVPEISLGLVLILLLFNKVGSPQFIVWLAAPIVLGIIYFRNEMRLPARAALIVAAMTQIIYPWFYWLFVEANPVLVFAFTIKVAGLVTMLIWTVVVIWREGSVRNVRGTGRSGIPVVDTSDGGEFVAAR